MPRVDKDRLEKFRKGELKFSRLFGIDANHIASLLLCGHNFLSQGRVEEAKKIFEGLAVLNPDNPYVHSALGSIHQREEQLERAILRYSRALRLFPDDIHALTNRGEIYLKIGRFLEAAGDLKKAIELDPARKHASSNRARLLAEITAQSLDLAEKQKLSAAGTPMRR